MSEAGVHVVLSNELLAHLRDGLRFISVASWCTSDWTTWRCGIYPLSPIRSDPLLGPTLSRLREYSCDRHGVFLSPSGARGLVLLASGPHAETDVDVDERARQRPAPSPSWQARSRTSPPRM